MPKYSYCYQIAHACCCLLLACCCHATVTVTVVQLTEDDVMRLKEIMKLKAKKDFSGLMRVYKKHVQPEDLRPPKPAPAIGHDE